MLTALGLVAISLCNVPYKWGGNDPLVGLDCSGFAQIPLKTVGVLPKEKDRNTQMIYEYLRMRPYTSEMAPDSILFYGKSLSRLTHMAIVISDELMIEAGGGDRNCLDIYDAIRNDAKVRVVPIRHNFVACVKVKYKL
jgi:cell wall-associated NlpC family hydrolase